MDEPAGRSPEEAVQALRDCYCGYMLRLTQADHAAGLRDYLAGWLGGGRRRREMEDTLTEFHAQAQERVADLCAALEDCPEQAGRSAAGAVEIILFYPQKQSKGVDLSMAAIEGLAMPLLPYLTPEDAAGFLARYRKRTPPRLMFPNQKALFRALQGRTGPKS